MQVPVEILFQMIGEREVEKRYMKQQILDLEVQVSTLRTQNTEMGEVIRKDHGEPT